MTWAIRWIAALVIVSVTLFILNQTSQVVMLAHTLHPWAGRAVLVLLLGFYAVAIAVPVLIWTRIPKALTPPVDGEASPDYPKYIEALHARLKRNPRSPNDLEPGRAGIEAAFRSLDAQSGDLIRKTASTIFVVTAISQNGRLDGIMVLAAQTRMIWQITRMYNQRPSLQELLQLYTNVAMTIFVATELDDLDIADQVEPVITAAIGSSVVGMIPGAAMVASIVTQALLEGAANAYLTLRVGIICQNYCKSVFTPFDVKRARRQASLSAAKTLGTIVMGSSGKVVKAILDAAKKAGGNTMDSAVSKMRDVGTRLNPFAKP
jgi:Domain of unknown function (DUF697)